MVSSIVPSYSFVSIEKPQLLERSITQAQEIFFSNLIPFWNGCKMGFVASLTTFHPIAAFIVRALVIASIAVSVIQLYSPITNIKKGSYIFNLEKPINQISKYQLDKEEETTYIQIMQEVKIFSKKFGLTSFPILSFSKKTDSQNIDASDKSGISVSILEIESSTSTLAAKKDDLLFTICHELSHIKHKDKRYGRLFEILSVLGIVLSSTFFISPINIAIACIAYTLSFQSFANYWQRSIEKRADLEAAEILASARGGIIKFREAIEDYKKIVSVLKKSEKRLEKEGSWLSKLKIKYYRHLNFDANDELRQSSHPPHFKRVQYLEEFERKKS